MGLQAQTIQGILGETLVYVCVVKRNNVVVDITGSTVWLTAKTRYTDPDPGVFQASTLNGYIALTAPTVGEFRVVLDADWTADLVAPLKLYYDVKVKEQDGNENVPIFGQLELLPNVTDAS